MCQSTNTCLPKQGNKCIENEQMKVTMNFVTVI